MTRATFANSVVDHCISTNDLARQLGNENYPHGTWVSARCQESGRGRLGRKWESVAGNLFLSMIVRLEDKKLWSWVPLAVAVGAADALDRFDARLPVRIKWPNDLWIGRAKLGGILCEATAGGIQSFIIAGIGLNCEAAPEVDIETASLTQARGRKTTADEIREVVVAGVQGRLSELEREGPEATRQAYEKIAVFQKGAQVEWRSGLRADEAPRQGVVVGLGSSGELKVLSEQDSAQVISLFAEDVTLRRSGML